MPNINPKGNANQNHRRQADDLELKKAFTERASN
jgi:hypothetical protein